jgi:hypothetical protein
MAIEVEPKPAPTQSHDQFEVVADGLGRYTSNMQSEDHIHRLHRLS